MTLGATTSGLLPISRPCELLCRRHAARAQELEAAVADGSLSEVVYCYSREPGAPRTYVQDGVVARAADVTAVLSAPNAHLFVCGDVTMAACVAGAVQQAVGLEAMAAMQVGRVWLACRCAQACAAQRRPVPRSARGGRAWPCVMCLRRVCVRASRT
jgi:hypothetical protein